MNSRNVYLKMKTLEEARGVLFDQFVGSRLTSGEMVSVTDAVGRVLAEPVYARLSSPGYNSSAMDGIAVLAENTFGASEGAPKELVVGKDAFYVNTGNVLPAGTDSVIMIEHVNVVGEGLIEIEAPAFPWQYVRKVGEDIVATELLFPQNHRVTPYCIGALISGGVFQVSVRKKPKVFIVPTGNEIVDFRTVPSGDLPAGKVLDSNAFVLGAMVEKAGGTYVRSEVVEDDLETIRNVVGEAARGEYDMVLILGGSSAGSMDYARPVIESLGKLLVHGVTMMPGKPVLFGPVSDTPVYGIPGYPVSAIVAFEQFVAPVLAGLLGQSEELRQKIDVSPSRKITSKLGSEEFLRVKLGSVGDRVVATPLPRGSGSITSITEADGIIRIPNHVEGVLESETVSAELLKPAASVENTIVVVGSHDNTIDLLTDQVRAKHPDVNISSSHVGSMGGLMALRRGACHLAGSHLLEESDGSYNVSHVKKYLAGRDVRIVNLVLREQGLIVPKGNPKGIRGIEDLSRPDISFINRQAGSGTRILLDYKLGELGIDPSEIRGYGDDEYTHMAVAVSVLSRTVDTGLGIYAAAKALGLDFVPVVTEQYDLVIDSAYMDDKKIKVLLETIATEDFKSRVRELGGYDTSKTGEIIL